MRISRMLCIGLVSMICSLISSQNIVDVVPGWSGNSVNAVVFRQNSLVTMRDTQFIAFYNQNGDLVLGKRHLSKSVFELHQTQYKGNLKDAHNCISIMLDGDGYLHASWDHHGHPLHYARSQKPYGLELGPMMSMSGEHENNVTYPQFFKMPDGNLIFLYRDGESGRGNLVMQKYMLRDKRWIVMHNNLIDGEEQRNAYWQAYVDGYGTIHLSWVWRETWDVASNHDMCYACSKDGGQTWIKTNGEAYQLPITTQSAEYACLIPQKSELINQTSMTADTEGKPIIASYWRDNNSEVPQYHIIRFENGQWRSESLEFRSQSFSLSGGGTKRIPISRPQIIAQQKMGKVWVYLIFRDEDRGSKISLAKVKMGKQWKIKLSDISELGVGAWEPTYDTELWKTKKRLHLFMLKVEQVDSEGVANIKPEMVRVLELSRKF